LFFFTFSFFSFFSLLFVRARSLGFWLKMGKLYDVTMTELFSSSLNLHLGDGIF